MKFVNVLLKFFLTVSWIKARKLSFEWFCLTRWVLLQKKLPLKTCNNIFWCLISISSTHRHNNSTVQGNCPWNTYLTMVHSEGLVTYTWRRREGTVVTAVVLHFMVVHSALGVFSPQYSGFPLSQKTNIFDLIWSKSPQLAGHLCSAK